MISVWFNVRDFFPSSYITRFVKLLRYQLQHHWSNWTWASENNPSNAGWCLVNTAHTENRDFWWVNSSLLDLEGWQRSFKYLYTVLGCIGKKTVTIEHIPQIPMLPAILETVQHIGRRKQQKQQSSFCVFDTGMTLDYFSIACLWNSHSLFLIPTSNSASTSYKGSNG